MTFAQAINNALLLSMKKDDNMLVFGLGVPDPKTIFGTTQGLQETFGEKRVFDIPCSENAMMGVAIGAGLNNVRSVFVHQRFDFFILAFDQLINNGAKWHYMFGGGLSVPVTIRLIIGRGFGQGPTHSQSLQSLLAHIPGLKIIAPTTPKDAKGLLIASIFDPNPVVFLEHRWLFNTEEEVSNDYFEVSLDKAKIMREGNNITIVAYSLMSMEAMKSSSILAKYDIDVEIIDLISIAPLDLDTIYASIKKTKHLIVLDLSHESFSVASEVVSKVSQNCFSYLKVAPMIVGLEDIPSPTSYGLSKTYYKNANDIISASFKILNKEIDSSSFIETKGHHDIPGDWFKGPF